MAAEIIIYGIIGEDIFATDVMDDLKAARGSPLIVRFNSPGGVVSEGISILNAIKRDGRKVEAHVDGIAASIASVIACGLPGPLVMHEGSQLLIHDAWASAAGTADQLRKLADQIDATSKIILDVYVKRTGKTADEIAAMMARETLMSAEEAVALGFATHVAAPLKIAACALLDRKQMARLLFEKETDDMTATVKAETPKTETAPIASVDSIIAAERNRATAILNAVSNARLAPDFGAKLVADGLTVDEAQAKIINEFARVNAAATGPEIRNITVGNSYDSPQSKADAVAGAIYARMSGKAPEGRAREYMGLTLNQMAGELGAPRGWLDPTSIRNGGLLTTSDLPQAFGSALGRRLIDQMNVMQGGVAEIAKPGIVPDFRQQTAVSVSKFPALEPVMEGGEVPFGYIDDHGETYAVSTFAKGISFSFQAWTNDDLGVIETALRGVAVAANKLRAELILSAMGATMADGHAVFSSQHGNLAGTGHVPDATTLSAARLAMRLQTALGDSEAYLNLRPAILLVGPALETTAQQLVAQITPHQTADVNVFSGSLRIVVEPRLGDEWFVFTEPNEYEVIRFATLAGYEMPKLEQDIMFTQLGMSWRAHWHCGAAPIDFRGAYKNTGVAE